VVVGAGFGFGCAVPDTSEREGGNGWRKDEGEVQVDEWVCYLFG